MRLLVDIIWGRLGLSQMLHSFNLKISEPMTDLTIRPPELKIFSDQVELTIDAEACRQDLNLYDPVDFTRHYANLARQKAAEGILQCAGEGDRYAAVEAGGGAFAAVAATKGLEEVDLTLISASLPDISFHIIKGEKDFQQGGVSVGFAPGKVGLESVPGRVKTCWRRSPELHIQVKGSLDVQA